MKALTTPAIFTAFSSRVDGALSFRGTTPELSSVEKVALMDLQNQNVTLLIQPKDSVVEGLTEVKGEFDKKSPSQRLRGVLYRLWQYLHAQQKIEIGFDNFYLQQMERVIEDVKAQLPQEPF